MKKSTLSAKQRLGRLKTVVSTVFIALLIVQIFLFSGVATMGVKFSNDLKSIHDIRSDYAQAFVTDTIRNQLRITLNGARQSWIQYLNTHPNEEVILKVDGKYVYTNPKGDRIVFDSATMDKRRSEGAFYDIIEKATGNVLMAHVRATWNTEVVDRILSIIGSPLKGFGPKGYPVIMDAYTGEIIMDVTLPAKPIPDVLQEDGKQNITLWYKSPENQNPAAYQEYVTELMKRRDTDKTSNLVNLFNESHIPTMADASDLKAYPLGDYNRKFVEKIILPYETMGIEGQEMQIAIMLSASEGDVFESYKGLKAELSDIESSMNNVLGSNLLFPLISVLISLVTILLAIFSLRLSVHLCERKSGNDSNKERDT